MNKKSTKNPFRPFINIISRYNLIIFITIIVASLIVAILTLNSILQLPYSDGYSPTQSNGITFDKTIIDQLNKLKTSDVNSADQTLPSGRINPFSE